jgi:hypothetical protein
MLIISLTIDFEALKSIKRDLKKLSPSEKSSLLTEAVARGLRHNTHASLLADIKKNGNVTVNASAEAFQNYCKSKDRSIPTSAFFLSLALIAIRRVRTNFHLIGGSGYGYGQPQRLNGRKETDKENYDRFHEGRKELDSIPIAQQFLRSLFFLNQVPQIKTINTKISSYGLKHIAEKLPCTYPDGEILGPGYVCNAALILVALHLGLKFRTYRDDRGYDSPNMNFNISHKAIVDIDCVIRPDGARSKAQARTKR